MSQELRIGKKGVVFWEKGEKIEQDEQIEEEY